MLNDARRCWAVALVVVVAACGSTDPASSDPTSPAAAPATDVVGSTDAGGSARRESFTTADGTTIDYVVAAPTGRRVGEPGKVLLAFPPGGQDLDLAERIVDDQWAPEALARDFVVVSPAAPSTGLYYDDASAALVAEFLDHVAEEYPPVDGRFDLGGVSNGGLSAFRAALSMPDRFRSLVVFPGYSPGGGDDPALSELSGLGVAMFVGGDDSAWLEPSRRTEQVLDGLGITVELHVIPGEGHIIESLTSADLLDALERVRT